MLAHAVPYETRYRIVRRLHFGQVTEVLLGVERGPHGFERPVVLKRLLPRYAKDALMREMLAREASALASVTHPGIIHLYDLTEIDHTPTLVLEYVDGVSLQDWLLWMQNEGLVVDRDIGAHIGSALFDAVAAAHGARHPTRGEFSPVLHGDINPSNILLGWDGSIRLIDFGAARHMGQSLVDAMEMTINFRFTAPEQALGDALTTQSDIYACCAVMGDLMPRELEANDVTGHTVRAHLDVGMAIDPDARRITAHELASTLRAFFDVDQGRSKLTDTLRTIREQNASVPEHLSFERLRVDEEPTFGGDGTRRRSELRLQGEGPALHRRKRRGLVRAEATTFTRTSHPAGRGLARRPHSRRPRPLDRERTPGWWSHPASRAVMVLWMATVLAVVAFVAYRLLARS